MIKVVMLVQNARFWRVYLSTFICFRYRYLLTLLSLLSYHFWSRHHPLEKSGNFH